MQLCIGSNEGGRDSERESGGSTQPSSTRVGNGSVDSGGAKNHFVRGWQLRAGGRGVTLAYQNTYYVPTYSSRMQKCLVSVPHIASGLLRQSGLIDIRLRRLKSALLLVSDVGAGATYTSLPLIGCRFQWCKIASLFILNVSHVKFIFADHASVL